MMLQCVITGCLCLVCVCLWWCVISLMQHPVIFKLLYANVFQDFFFPCMLKEGPVYWTDVPGIREQVVNICYYNNQMRGRGSPQDACSICICLRWTFLPVGLFLSLCKSLNDLVYPWLTMITEWAESFSIKRSRKSVIAHKFQSALCLSQTHSRTHTLQVT